MTGQVWEYPVRVSEDAFNWLQRLVEEDPLLRAFQEDRAKLLDSLGNARDGKVPVRDEQGGY